jgi:hypothetical protein
VTWAVVFERAKSAVQQGPFVGRDLLIPRASVRQAGRVLLLDGPASPGTRQGVAILSGQGAFRAPRLGRHKKGWAQLRAAACGGGWWRGGWPGACFGQPVRGPSLEAVCCMCKATPLTTILRGPPIPPPPPRPANFSLTLPHPPTSAHRCTLTILATLTRKPPARPPDQMPWTPPATPPPLSARASPSAPPR